MRSVDLEEALELVRHDVAADVTYPLKETARKRTSHEMDLEAGEESEKAGSSKKKQKTEGILLTKDDISERKYGPNNMPKSLKSLVLKRISKNKHLKNDPVLCQECLKLISNSLAKRTWEKYGSALTLWEKFAAQKNLKNFSG